MKMNERLPRLIVSAIIQLLVFGFFAAPAADAQETYGERTEALMRWVESELAKIGQGLPDRIDFSNPSAAATANAMRLISTSPLTGSAMQQPAPGAGGSPPLSGGTPNQSRPPLNIQLPPPPPERYAPSARGQPPIQLPDPSTIPSPPAAQAPPQQGRPPIQMPIPSGGAQGRPPIQLPNPATIPLPPHPPEEQAPWRRGG